MITTYIAASVLISMAYYLLAVVTLFFVRLPIPRRLNLVLIAAGATFFFGCGSHHMHMAVHVAIDAPVRTAMLTWHLLAVELMQAIAAPVAAVLVLFALRHLTIRVEGNGV
jgi:hypothetical protein